MKKLFALALALSMLLMLAACSQKKPSEDVSAQDTPAPVESEVPTHVGGWTITKDAAVSDEARAAFDKALEGLTGVDYQPLALLGTQVVAGTNYCILCEAKVVYPDAVPYYALVYIYADLQGGAQILNIVNLDIGEIAETGEVRAAEDAPAALPGAWTVDHETKANIEGGLMHLASQVVNGTNRCILCEGAKLVIVNESLDGQIKILKTVDLDLGALIN